MTMGALPWCMSGVMPGAATVFTTGTLRGGCSRFEDMGPGAAVVDTRITF